MSLRLYVVTGLGEHQAGKDARLPGAVQPALTTSRSYYIEASIRIGLGGKRMVWVPKTMIPLAMIDIQIAL